MAAAMTGRRMTAGFFFFKDTATTEIYTLSLHDALPISTDQVTEVPRGVPGDRGVFDGPGGGRALQAEQRPQLTEVPAGAEHGEQLLGAIDPLADDLDLAVLDRVDQVAAGSLLKDHLARLVATALGRSRFAD